MVVEVSGFAAVVPAPRVGNDSKRGTAEPEERRERVNASYGIPESKGERPAHRAWSWAEGRRAEQSSGAEVVADGTCRVADRASRRKLERFEASVVTVDSFGFLPGRVPLRRQPACDESSMGLCHAREAWHPHDELGSTAPSFGSKGPDRAETLEGASASTTREDRTDAN